MAVFTNMLGDFYNPGSNSTANRVLTVGATGAAVGEIVFLGCYDFGSDYAGSIADSKSNTWSIASSINPTGSHFLRVFFTVVTTPLVNTDTITITPAGNFRASCTDVSKMSGQAAGANPTDGQNTNSTSGTTISLTVSPTSGHTNDLAYFFSGGPFGGSSGSLNVGGTWQKMDEITNSYDGGIHFIGAGSGMQQANTASVSGTHTWGASMNTIGIVGVLAQVPLVLPATDSVLSHRIVGGSGW